MQIEHLRTFVDLAETLNFRQTSENMNLTQPAVTQIIKSLEVQINVELFNRTKQRVRLTQAGIVFYNDTKLLLKKFDSSVEQVKEIAQQANHTFTIGFSGTAFEMNILPKIISKFKKNIQLFIYI
ncbi:LysR family transcriptional regulator [Candidatus Enterococcus ferrettii]|uniref:HTH lysR-type domain-containing protein n=1 Tax=Candidatus Enterococcus ferrettii TaxID=2815324 RepID=A0ABV0ELY6_9ENTE|nr:LysR family transcriptional regulator [Enterococcus sp. 665A]